MSAATDRFDTVVASIPHHDMLRGMWSGRVTRISDHHLRDCPKCGRQLPVTSESATLSAEHEFAPSGQYVPTDDELSLQCFVCGPERERGVPVGLDELFVGAHALRDKLDHEKWHAWVELFDEAFGAADDAARALAIGQSLLLLHDGIDQIKGHDERSEPLFALSIGSAVHWPHAA
ncbi:MAG: hypothetical protein U0W40_08575 [Acidimicrobiia bacterium]